jgi:3-methyladenine DNA glycosylase AlkC
MTRIPPDTTSKPALVAWAKDPARAGVELASATGFFPEVDRVIAARADCPPDLLATLAHSSDKATRAKVAANPNTPTSDYVQLGQQFPKEFIANPLLDLLLLENPALLSDIPGALLVQMAKRPECPDDFLVWAAAHADEHVQLAVAMNPKAPEAALASLRESVHAKVRESVSSAGALLEGDPEMMFREAVRERLAALTHEEAQEAWSKKYIGLPQFRELSPIARLRVAAVVTPRMAKLLANALSTQEQPIEESDFLLFIGKDPNKTVLSRHLLGTVLALGAGPFVEPSRIARVAASTEWLVRAAVARNSGTPPNILKKLSGDPHPVVRALAAGAVGLAESRSAVVEVEHANTVLDDARVTKEVQKLFKGTKGEYARRRFAQHKNTPVALLEALAKDEHWVVRSSVAGNPNTPVAVLDALAQEWDQYVPIAVAENPNTPVALLETLVRGDEGVSGSVAKNPNTPIAVLEALAKDDAPYVRGSVAQNPNTPIAVLDVLLEALANDDASHVRRVVAQNPNAPVALFEALANDEASDVRRAVAENPNTPAAVLAALANDEASDVRRAVARNPNTPVAILEALANDEASDVRRAVARNPNTPVALLEALARDESAYVRESVAQNPGTPWQLREKLLEALAKDKDWHVRWAVASNPNAPAPVLEALAKDKDSSARASALSRFVRESVARNPNTPAAVLAALANDEASDVRESVAQNPNTPAAVLEALREEEARLFSEAFSMLSPRGKPVLPEASICRWLQQLTDFPATPDNKALTKASRSKNWLIRLGVALHPQASRAMLELLSADTDADVAAAARTKLSERRA